MSSSTAAASRTLSPIRIPHMRRADAGITSERLGNGLESALLSLEQYNVAFGRDGEAVAHSSPHCPTVSSQKIRCSKFAGAYGLRAAIDYLDGLGMADVATTTGGSRTCSTPKPASATT